VTRSCSPGFTGSASTKRSDRHARDDAETLDAHPERDTAGQRATPDVRAEQNDLRGALEVAVRGLPLDYRAPLILGDNQGLPTVEAAKLLDISVAENKRRLHRARLAVREAMADHLEHHP